MTFRQRLCRPARRTLAFAAAAVLLTQSLAAHAEEPAKAAGVKAAGVKAAGVKAAGVKAAGAKGAKPKVAVLTGRADEDLKELRNTLAKVPGVKFNADEIKFADFGRDGGLFTSFFTIELTDRSKTDIGAVAKAVAAANTSRKDRSPSAFYLIVRYRPDSTNDKQLRAALAKVKGVVADKSWAGDSNLWVSVDGSGQGKLAEITRALHEARIPIRDPILDTDEP